MGKREQKRRKKKWVNDNREKGREKSKRKTQKKEKKRKGLIKTEKKVRNE